jgi:acetylglutamate kinase
MTGLTEIAPILLKATERARKFAGRTFVVKLGGSAMEEPAATKGTLESLVALQSLGMSIILVHGGGKPIDRAMAEAGIEPRKVQGRRYTDQRTLEIVWKVLNDLNHGIVDQINALGGRAYGILDVAGYPLTGSRLTLIAQDSNPVDLGYVGKIDAVDMSGVSYSYFELPVIPSLAREASGNWLNVNADTVASAIAGAMQAEAAIFLTDTPGVLANRDDPSSLYARLTVAECRKLIADGTIAGGMIPKVEACFEALEAGAKRAVILDGRNPYALLGEFLTDLPAGTAITTS